MRDDSDEGEDYHHYVESPDELSDPDLDEAARLEREDDVEEAEDTLGIEVEDTPAGGDFEDMDPEMVDAIMQMVNQELDADMAGQAEDPYADPMGDDQGVDPDQEYIDEENADPRYQTIEDNTFQDGTEDPRGGQDQRFLEPHPPRKSDSGVRASRQTLSNEGSSRDNKRNTLTTRSNTMARQTLARGPQARRRNAEVDNSQGVNDTSGEFASKTPAPESATTGEEGARQPDERDDVTIPDPPRTDPQQASRKASQEFARFASWVSQTYGVTIRRAASDNKLRTLVAKYAEATGANVSLLMPGLKMAQRQAHNAAKQAAPAAKQAPARRTKQAAPAAKQAPAKRRKADNATYAPADDQVDVEAPVNNANNERGQQTQYEVGEFADNAADDQAKPDLSTDHIWTPGDHNRTSKQIKRASGMHAVRLAEAYIEAGISPADSRWKLAGQFEGMPLSVINDRTALLERVASAQANTRKVAGGVTRTSTRAVVPRNIGQGAPTQRVAATDDPSSDMDLFL